MSDDDLDRAVDARIDAYRPETIPPFEAIESRKRTRDRRRMAVGAGALSVVALAAAGVVVPALSDGGDRLTPGGPPEAVSITRFAVQYADGSAVEGRSDGADAALARCLELPGARDRAGVKLSDPIIWVVTVEGTQAQTDAVRDCLASLDEATVQAVPTSPAVAGDTEDDGVSQAAVRPSGQFRMQALATGTLRADPTTGCLWLEREDGKPTGQLLLQGEDYSVDFSQSPAAIRLDGVVVARVGERIEVGGGFTNREEGVEGCPVTAGPFLGYFERY